jgi:hypothetical protein
VSAKILIAIMACVALATLNVFQIIAAFLYTSFYSDLFQIAFMVMWLAITALGMILRRIWLIYAAQTIVAALSAWRMYRYVSEGYGLEPGNNPLSLFYGIIIIIIGYALVWCVTRSISKKTLNCASKSEI